MVKNGPSFARDLNPGLWYHQLAKTEAAKNNNSNVLKYDQKLCVLYGLSSQKHQLDSSNFHFYLSLGTLKCSISSHKSAVGMASLLALSDGLCSEVLESEATVTGGRK